MDTPEPLTPEQAAYAAALPDAEQKQFEAMSSADRDDLMLVMGWAAPALVEARQDDLDAARADLDEQRRADERAGGFGPETPPRHQRTSGSWTRCSPLTTRQSTRRCSHSTRF